MKTLEQIKEEYAIEKGFSSWYDLYKDHVFRINNFANHNDQVTERYAEEYAREALRLASESATTKQGYCSYGWTPSVRIVDKQSILSESNLPKHR